MKEITHFQDINMLTHDSRTQALDADLVQRGQDIMVCICNNDVALTGISLLLRDVQLRNSLATALARHDEETAHAKVLDQAEKAQKSFA